MYVENTFSDITAENVAELVKAEAQLKNGEWVFRGKSYSQWYELAYEAFESWFDGRHYGELFEMIGSELEEKEIGMFENHILGGYGTLWD